MEFILKRLHNNFTTILIRKRTENIDMKTKQRKPKQKTKGLLDMSDDELDVLVKKLLKEGRKWLAKQRKKGNL